MLKGSPAKPAVRGKLPDPPKNRFGLLSTAGLEQDQPEVVASRLQGGLQADRLEEDTLRLTEPAKIIVGQAQGGIAGFRVGVGQDRQSPLVGFDRFLPSPRLGQGNS